MNFSQEPYLGGIRTKKKQSNIKINEKVAMQLSNNLAVAGNISIANSKPLKVSFL